MSLTSLPEGLPLAPDTFLLVLNSAIDLILSTAPLRIKFRVFDGYEWSYPAYVNVTIIPLNDNAPVVELTPLNQVRDATHIMGSLHAGQWLFWQHISISFLPLHPPNHLSVAVCGEQ